jgi:hypothetical protein
VQATRLANVAWSEPADNDAVTRPTGASEWIGSVVAIIVCCVLGLSALMLVLSASGGWLLIVAVPAGLVIAVSAYGVARGLRGIVKPATPINYNLTNLMLELDVPPVGGTVHGRLRFESQGNQFPQSLTVELELQPEQHPDHETWLNLTTCKPDSTGVYEFLLDVPRHQTVLGETHGILQLNFNSQSVFERVHIDPIAQTPPLKTVFQPSRTEQLAAFEHGAVAELVSRAYNGQYATAGWLRHHGGPYLQDFSVEEKSRVLTIGFAELVDHLEASGWFVDKTVDVLDLPFDGTRILRQPGLYEVVYDQSDQQLKWTTRLHHTTSKREAHEAFILHSDPHAVALLGARELFELRSDGSDSRPAQSY